MRRFVTHRLVPPALFLATGLLVVAGGAVGQPGKDKEKDKGPKAAGKAADDLRKTFDRLTEVAQTPPAGKDAGRLLEHAKAFYREALKAYPDDPRRAAELAVAAKDAARGLEHSRRAAYRPVPGLPEPTVVLDGPAGPGRDEPAPKKKGKDKDGPRAKGPPPIGGPDAGRGPWSEALAALTAAREWVTTAGPGAARGPARDFADAAKAAYDQARAAYEAEDYRKAAALARAAEAWSHVGEHLERAGWEGTAGGPPPAPEPKRKDRVPPPPPPVRP